MKLLPDRTSLRWSGSPCTEETPRGRSMQIQNGRVMVPLYAARIEDLGPVPGKRIAQRWIARLDEQRTGDGREVPPYLRRELDRLLRRYAVAEEPIGEVDRDSEAAIHRTGQPVSRQGKGTSFGDVGRHRAQLPRCCLSPRFITAVSRLADTWRHSSARRRAPASRCARSIVPLGRRVFGSRDGEE